MDEKLKPQNAGSWQYFTLKNEQLLAERLAKSDLPVKEEDRQKATDALTTLAKTIRRLREKKKILRQATDIGKKLRSLEPEIRSGIAQLTFKLSKKSDAKNTLNQNIIRQNQNLYFIHKLQFALTLLEDKKERLETQLSKLGIKLERGEKY